VGLTETNVRRAEPPPFGSKEGSYIVLTIGHKTGLLVVVPGATTRRLRTVRSMKEWRRRHATVRRERQVGRALEAVSPGTLQDEVRTFAQTQFNR
jgi:hypothetical protein